MVEQLNVIKLLNTQGIPRGLIGAELSRRLKLLTGRNFSVRMNCPLSVEGGEEVCIEFEFGREPVIVRQSADVVEPGVIVAELPAAGLNDGAWLRPKVYICGEGHADISAGTAEDLRAFAADFMIRFVHRHRAIIRRTLVNARTQSDDLNSFLHRAFSSGMLHRSIGFEAASVFVADPISHMLRLRGTTGLAAAVRKAEIAFATDSNTKVGRAFNTREPYVEYAREGYLMNGASAERTAHGAWTRTYWPLQLQHRKGGENRLTARTPVLGVLRTVNLGWPGEVHLPPTWVELALAEFLAESLYNVTLGFIDVEEASFRREEAFHAASGVVDSITASAERLSQWIFGEQFGSASRPISKRFRLTPIGGSDDTENVRHLLRSIYSVALALGFQIERSDLEVSYDPTDVTPELLKGVILRALEMLPHIADAHSVEEYLSLPDVASMLRGQDYPPPVKGSPEGLTSVFLNVFENAVKYRRIGEPCKIELRIDTKPKEVVVEVRDYGIGVRREDLRRIFSRGMRTEEAKRHAKRGSGLGLNWCAGVLNRIGGSIRARYEDVGITIEIVLPRAGSR